MQAECEHLFRHSLLILPVKKLQSHASWFNKPNLIQPLERMIFMKMFFSMREGKNIEMILITWIKSIFLFCYWHLNRTYIMILLYLLFVVLTFWSCFKPVHGFIHSFFDPKIEQYIFLFLIYSFLLYGFSRFHSFIHNLGFILGHE